MDTDGDTVPDGCDACPAGDDLAGATGATLAYARDLCVDHDLVDTDFDILPNDCDICPGASDLLDTDGFIIPDGCDNCPGRRRWLQRGLHAFGDHLAGEGDQFFEGLFAPFEGAARCGRSRAHDPQVGVGGHACRGHGTKVP